MRRGIAALALITLAACGAETRSRPAIAWNASTGAIDVTQLREPERATVAVHSGPPDAPAMLGRVELRKDGLAFHPRFPLVPGLSYRVRVNDTETTIAIPKAAAAATTYVAQIFPTADELPANQLKFYLDFSAPMSVGDVYRHIHLLDEAGHDVPRAFLQTAHELWDARRQRFTLILDPGRIKRGLRANLESGAPLREGGRYRLRIDADWRDGDGNPLRAPFEKAFRVGAADRTMPEPKAWRVSAPAAGTKDPLRVTFDEPLDRALLDEVVIPDVDGDVQIAAAETEWVFRPKQPWPEGEEAGAERRHASADVVLPFTSRRP